MIIRLISISLLILLISYCSESVNEPADKVPVIKELIVAPDSVEIEGTCIVLCSLSEQSTDSLSYLWSASDGIIENYQDSYIIWTAPKIPGIYQIKCRVIDNEGYSDSSSVNIMVYRAPHLDRGLIGYWPFNGNANDKSPFENIGYIIGATFTYDRFENINRALLLNEGSYVHIPRSNILEPIDFSVSLWMKTSSLETSQYQTLIAKNDGYNAGFRLILRTELDKEHEVYGRLLFQVSDIEGQVKNLYSNSKIEKNKWIHVLISFESSTKMKMYLDGELNAEMAVFSPWDAETSLDFSIGRVLNSYPGYFLGTIDDIRFYNRILFPEEISALYNEE